MILSELQILKLCLLRSIFQSLLSALFILFSSYNILSILFIIPLLIDNFNIIMLIYKYSLIRKYKNILYNYNKVNILSSIFFSIGIFIITYNKIIEIMVYYHIPKLIDNYIIY